MLNRLLTFLICCVLPALPALGRPGQLSRAQADSTEVYKIYYYVDHSELDVNYMHNALMLRQMDALVDSLLAAGSALSVHLVSGASPEGTEEGNRKLGQERSEEMRRYLLSHHYRLQERMLTVASTGSDWEGLLRMLDRSRYYWAPEAARIIRTTPIWVRNRRSGIVDSRKRKLMDLHLGDAWRTMDQDLFPYLRKTEVSITFPTGERPQPKADTVFIVDHRLDTVTVEKEKVVQAPGHKHGFLLYTNLAYDVAGTPSIGTEFYMGKGWALNARWSGGWWSSRPKNRFYRLYGAELALRKYFRLPSDNGAGMFRSSTGHHLGAYGQLLTYDFEFSGKGYMGGMPEKNLFAAPTWSAGLEYGYTFAIGEHLNLDLSLGVGYLQGPQWMYDPASGDGTYPLTGFRTFRWIGPTRADVSLYWLIGFENKRR